MPTTPCRHCGNQVAPGVAKCPQCGGRLSVGGTDVTGPAVLIVVGLLLGIFVNAAAGSVVGFLGLLFLAARLLVGG